MIASQQDTLVPISGADCARVLRGFGQHIRHVRTVCGLSQVEVAAMSGVSQSVLSRLETGRNLATPFVVVLRVHVALGRALREATLVGPAERALLEAEHGLWLRL